MYNTDHCWTPNAHFGLFLLNVYTFYSRYNMVWIANTEIVLDSNKCNKEDVMYLYVCYNTHNSALLLVSRHDVLFVVMFIFEQFYLFFRQ